MGETKKEKFVRLAENRTNKALEMIRLIGNLSNKSVYDYSAEDITKIFDALESEVALAKKQFTDVGGTDKFKLI
jgi:ribosomal protein L30E